MKSILQSIITFTLVAVSYGEENIPFFPTSERSSDTTISSFEEHWYSKNLTLMKEESIYRKREQENLEIYRFTLLPTWGEPRSVTISRNRKNLAAIQHSRLDSEGLFDGKLVEKKKIELKEREFKDFKKLFEATAFSKQTTSDPMLGLDGSQWILERLKNGDYHIVVRWTADAYNPEKRGTKEFVDLCNWMLDHAPRTESQNQSGDDNSE
ncbi:MULTISPECIES: hypothetical protein [unclassified Lentimonas]|uniref:hypothetical protein n=1 Tax=unclassified Lentimonas TaxID=2630993 RepID=UPI0013251105|nr:MULTISPECIES: hypothetical protein [unclassified Lentimonas]CAA6696637.1 Unannotated [Lentimonas sp. CC10]CAA6697431.1 Unannotated [Lentimonas sp. CC19]CAA7072507.1 Unannotated [Lentimonas sp. CC11]